MTLREALLAMRDGIDMDEVHCAPVEAGSSYRYVIDKALREDDEPIGPMVKVEYRQIQTSTGAYVRFGKGECGDFYIYAQRPELETDGPIPESSRYAQYRKNGVVRSGMRLTEEAVLALLGLMTERFRAQITGCVSGWTEVLVSELPSCPDQDTEKQ